LTQEGLSWILDKALRVLTNYPLCDRCLGRLFASYGRGFSNKDRGRAIKLLLVMELHRRAMKGDIDAKQRLAELASNLVDFDISRTLESLGLTNQIHERSCFICGGLLDEIVEMYSHQAACVLSSSGVTSFVVGIRVPKQMLKRESEVVRIANTDGWESLKSELKREIGKRIQSISRLQVDFENPEAIAIIDLARDSVLLEFPSVLVFGYYWKIGRRISQNMYLTKDKVKRYPLSIEEAVLKVLGELFPQRGGEFEVKIHAAGREDVDVRMLGSGRPLIIEIKNVPKKSINLIELEKALNNQSIWLRFSVSMFAKRRHVSVLKTERGAKIYRALIYIGREISEEDIALLEKELSGRIIKQRTPTRVLHRRRDVLRRRRVYDFKAMIVGSNIIEALVFCEGGLYIKELVSGDNGRTSPSLSEILKAPAKVLELDVLYVKAI